MRIPAFFTRKHKIKKGWVREFGEDDPQAPVMYLMERSFMGQSVGVAQDHEFLESVARHAARKWGIEAPVLTFDEDKGVYGRTYWDRINLTPDPDKPGDNLITLLHELAHWIIDRKYPAKTQAHGPEFVYVYGKLLDQYKIMPEVAYKAMCKSYGLKTLR